MKMNKVLLLAGAVLIVGSASAMGRLKPSRYVNVAMATITPTSEELLAAEREGRIYSPTIRTMVSNVMEGYDINGDPDKPRGVLAGLRESSTILDAREKEAMQPLLSYLTRTSALSPELTFEEQKTNKNLRVQALLPLLERVKIEAQRQGLSNLVKEMDVEINFHSSSLAIPSVPVRTVKQQILSGLVTLGNEIGRQKVENLIALAQQLR